ncbi:unnamed protein product, partial [marine sediment metagenome]
MKAKCVCNRSQLKTALAAFNINKAQQLGEINATGKQLKIANEELSKTIKYLTEKGLANEKEIKTLETQINDLKKIEVKEIPFATSKIDKVKVEIQGLEKKITDNFQPNPAPLEDRRSMLQANIAEVEATEKTKVRIEELKTEEKKLAAEYEELERQISLLEKFTVAKVEMLEEKINSKFSLARFKLFEKQINEGIRETCITLYDGIPYGYGL